MQWLLIVIVIIIGAFIVRSIVASSDSDDTNNDTDESYLHREVKTIPGEKTSGKYYKKFKTKVVGVTFDNLNGSSRQVAISKLKPGDRLQLAWDPDNEHDTNAIMVFGKGNMTELDSSSCIGHLKADLAEDVVQWIQDDDVEGVYAEAIEVLGGTDELPTLGCLIELTVY